MSDTQRRSKDGSGLSRRDFLRTTGAAATAATLAEAPALSQGTDAPRSEKSATPAIGPAPVKLTLDVNDANMTTTIEPRVTLLDALRNYLDVTGCKRVCDRGTCGAC